MSEGLISLFDSVRPPFGNLVSAIGGPRSLRGRNIRSEKVSQRGQFFDLLRRIVGLRNDKDRRNGPLWRFRSRNTFYRADS